MATLLISTYLQKLEIIVKIEIISIEAVYREILMFKVNTDLLFFENVHYTILPIIPFCHRLVSVIGVVQFCKHADDTISTSCCSISASPTMIYDICLMDIGQS